MPFKKIPTKKRQAEALWASVEHWLENCELMMTDHSDNPMLWAELQFGESSCPLCQLYRTDNCSAWRVPCPVKVDTGRTTCDGSPWDNVFAAYEVFMQTLWNVDRSKKRGRSTLNLARLNLAGAVLKEYQYIVKLALEFAERQHS